MWAPPLREGPHHWMVWETLSENRFAKIIQHRLDGSCKIVTKYSNLVLATSSSLVHIQPKWELLANDILPRASGIDTEREIEEFISAKIRSLVVQQTQDRAKRATNSSLQLSPGSTQEPQTLPEKFHRPTETLIAAYQATLLFKVPRPGTAYITRNWILFSSPMWADIVEIPFTDVARIDKVEVQVGVIVSGLHVEDSNNQTWKFAVFGKRDELNDILQQLWKRAMENMGISASFVRSQTEKRRYGEGATDLTDSPKRETSLLSVSKAEIEGRTKNENFCRLFQLPQGQILYGEYRVYNFQYVPSLEGKSGGPGKATAKAYEGSLYLSTSFLCFHTSLLLLSDGPPIEGNASFIIPLREIKKAKKPKRSFTNSVFAEPSFAIMLFTGTSLLKFEINAKTKLYTKIVEACRDFRKESGDNCALPACLRSMKTLTPHHFDMETLNDLSQFTPKFLEHQSQLSEDFDEYFKSFGSHICMPHTPKLDQLTRAGIPIGMKSAMWQFLSRSFAIQTTKPKDYYRSLHESQHSIWLLLPSISDGSCHNKDLLVLDQIERDLHRSLPCQSYYSVGNIYEGQTITEESSKGIVALRRVLHAYAAHCPDIGYCQSMNIVVAALLMFVEEEECFYLLCAIIQKVPEYYEKNMLGSIVDINLFYELLKARLPRLVEHLTSINTDVTLLGMYRHRPTEVGLAVFKMHQDRILEMHDLVSVSDYMKEGATFDVEALCHSAFEEFRLNSEEINALRNFHKMRAIQELQKRNKTAVVRDLRKITSFTNQELDAYYEDFKAALSLDTWNYCLLPDQFISLFSSHVPWWPISHDCKKEWKKLLDLFDLTRDGVISFSNYTRGLDLILHGLLNVHQKLAFDLYATNNVLPKENFGLAAKLVLYMHSSRAGELPTQFQKTVERRKSANKDPFEILPRRLNEVWVLIKEVEHAERQGNEKVDIPTSKSQRSKTTQPQEPSQLNLLNLSSSGESTQQPQQESLPIFDLTQMTPQSTTAPPQQLDLLGLGAPMQSQAETGTLDFFFPTPVLTPTPTPTQTPQTPTLTQTPTPTQTPTNSQMPFDSTEEMSMTPEGNSLSSSGSIQSSASGSVSSSSALTESGKISFHAGEEEENDFDSQSVLGTEFLSISYEQFQIACSLILADAQGGGHPASPPDYDWEAEVQKL